MEEVYWAKIKNHNEWEFIYYHKGQYLDDNMEEIHEDWIEHKILLSDLCKYIKNALYVANFESIERVAAKALLNYVEEYFSK